MMFSIITPSYRQLDWLECCIASIADQQGVEVEHFVQDAGTEGFAEFAEKMRQRWPDRSGYQRIMVSEKDGGMYDAVNRGLCKARGDICAYLNCDEQYLPGSLARVQDFFCHHPRVEVLFGAVLVANGDGQAICHRSVSVPRPWHVMVSGNLTIFTAATFFRREVVLQGHLFPEGWKDVGDAVWALELGKKKVRCQATDAVFSIFTDTGENMNLKPNALAEKKRLRQQAPKAAQRMAPLLILAHRMQRWLAGAYRKRDLEYRIWRRGNDRKRQAFRTMSVGPFWPGRP
jgi:glycosyltransferase involved in cell wall biosynthesis